MFSNGSLLKPVFCKFKKVSTFFFPQKRFAKFNLTTWSSQIQPEAKQKLRSD